MGREKNTMLKNKEKILSKKDIDELKITLKKNIWKNGPQFKRWEYTQKYKLWVYSTEDIVHMFCAGDRLVTYEIGLEDCYPIIFGSESEKWHIIKFNIDLKSAIEWLYKAKYKELENYLWCCND